MTTFNSYYLRNECENKESGCPTQIIDDPFDDLFDQFISSKSLDTHTQWDQSDSSEILQPAIDEAVSSGSYFTDSASSDSSYRDLNPFQIVSPKENVPSLSRSAFLPRNFATSSRRQKLQPAVSGLELLQEIEGQYHSISGAGELPVSAPASASEIPLRRKPNFHPTQIKALPIRSHRVTKGKCDSTSDPSMIRPAFCYRDESPRSQEWSGRLEQISLQSPTSQFRKPPSPSVSYPDLRQSSAPDLRYNVLRDQFYQEQEAGGGHAAAQASASTCKLEAEETQHQLSGSLPWTSSSGYVSQFNHTIAPTQLHSDWNYEDANQSYYINALASKSAPALAHQASLSLTADPHPIGYIDEETDPPSSYLIDDLQPTSFPPTNDDTSFSSHYPPPPAAPRPYPNSTPTSTIHPAQPSLPT
ncbi:MAG: hypothetical protein Q9190_006510, partial [Brigantiaea leucoxantha]